MCSLLLASAKPWQTLCLFVQIINYSTRMFQAKFEEAKYLTLGVGVVNVTFTLVAVSRGFFPPTKKPQSQVLISLQFFRVRIKKYQTLHALLILVWGKEVVARVGLASFQFTQPNGHWLSGIHEVTRCVWVNNIATYGDSMKFCF